MTEKVSGSSASTLRRVAVIGGGITGLAAAQRLASRSDNTQIVVFESSQRLGGIIRTETADGFRFRMIGAHLKTKAPHGANGPEEVRRIGIANRRKQLAECVWLRRRALEHLGAGDSLMIMGDLNDGPGLDEYEKLFGRSGVEIVLGWDEARETRLYDPHARMALSKKAGLAPASARFYLDEEKRYFTALLDYIMVSPDLRAKKQHWRIWHPFDDPACYQTEELREALLMASDHFPVSIDLPI